MVLVDLGLRVSNQLIHFQASQFILLGLILSGSSLLICTQPTLGTAATDDKKDDAKKELIKDLARVIEAKAPIFYKRNIRRVHPRYFTRGNVREMVYTFNTSTMFRVHGLRSAGSKLRITVKDNNSWRQFGILVQCSSSQPLKLKPYGATVASVTRLGNLLDFGKLFKAFGNN